MLIYLVNNTIDGQGASPRELWLFSRLQPAVEILVTFSRRLPWTVWLNSTPYIIQPASHPANAPVKFTHMRF